MKKDFINPDNFRRGGGEGEGKECNFFPRLSEDTIWEVLEAFKRSRLGAFYP